MTEAQRHEVATWLEAQLDIAPPLVVSFLKIHLTCLKASQDLPRKLKEMVVQLQRAMGIKPSSERRRSGNPLGGRAKRRRRVKGQTKRQRLEQRHDELKRLEGVHKRLQDKHKDSAARIAAKLDKMAQDPPETAQQPMSLQDLLDEMPVEQIQLTAQQEAACDEHAEQCANRMVAGIDWDDEDYEGEPELESSRETLMPAGPVVVHEVPVLVEAPIPEDLAGSQVVKTLTDQRVRYDISMAVTPIQLEVQKHILVDSDGQRTVVSASTEDFGPRGYSVTWGTLVTLSVLVAQFAMPLNRLAILFSTELKAFTAGGLGRMLHYVAARLLPIYLKLYEQMADSPILSGDDTSCRVLEVSSYLDESGRTRQQEPGQTRAPPWAGYRTTTAAESNLEQCRQRHKDRIARRQNGDRTATRGADEEPSLGVLLGRIVPFESKRKDGKGAKQSLNTTVVTGRSVPQDPRSLIVMYRSHLGSFGNLLTSLLRRRDPALKEVIVQGDLSTSNRVTDVELTERFALKVIGCTAHARRPFALYEDEDPVHCPHMLHLFSGIFWHEQQLDEFGRNWHNVGAVRDKDDRRLWGDIKELAETMSQKWSKGTKLGVAARYIINHFDELTAYLDDPRLEATNNMRERLLRTEKLIENSSMFRKSLEGRFALDIIRTVVQTAVAARVPVHDYLPWALKTPADEIEQHAEEYTPYAYHQIQLEADAEAEDEDK